MHRRRKGHGLYRGLVLWQRTLSSMNVVLVSGFFDLDAMNFVECPRCRLPPGKICIDHLGKKLTKVILSVRQISVHGIKDRANLYIEGPVQIEKVREYQQEAGQVKR
jgi:hypothetical protein